MIEFKGNIYPKLFERRPSQRRDHFLANLIIEYGFEKVAEIGVLGGGCARSVLWSPAGKIVKDYIGVDNWLMCRRPGQRYIKTLSLMTYFPQLRLMRLDSVDAAKLFLNGYFDLVFIDADHSYNGVTADIKAWMPKIRKGGIISGHDYTDGLERKGCFVKQAVDDFFGKGNFTSWPDLWCWAKEIS